jgi:hypothetical protein
VSRLSAQERASMRESIRQGLRSGTFRREDVAKLWSVRDILEEEEFQEVVADTQWGVRGVFDDLPAHSFACADEATARDTCARLRRGGTAASLVCRTVGPWVEVDPPEENP